MPRRCLRGIHALMSSYRGRHAARHARPRASRLGSVGAALRRPAVSASLALAVVATTAAGVSAQGSAQVGPAAFVLGSESQSRADQQRADAAADATRLTAERAKVNAVKAAEAAKAEAARKAKEAAALKARKAAAQKAARDQARRDILARAQADPKSAARELMADYGFGADQWNCLDQLVIGESTWNSLAVTPSSGAYGLFQSLPAEKMSSVADDWATNPVTQIKWGLQYIKSTYGTPCGAWGAWNNRYPHWY